MNRTLKYASAAGSLLALFAILLLAAAGAGAQDTKPANTRKPIPIPKHPEERRFDNLRGSSYCEVWLFVNTPEGIAAVYYNTAALNNAADKMDTCPASMWEKVTVPALEAQYDVLAAHKNGPRWFTMDWFKLPVGPVETFDGIETRWMGQALMPKGKAPTGTLLSPYVPVKSYRKSEVTFEKGKPVFVLEDGEGTPWVMQSFGPNLTYDALKDLGSKLKPPAGWKYRVVVLDRDLILSTPEGYNWIMKDDLECVYDACKEGTCNFKP